MSASAAGTSFATYWLVGEAPNPATVGHPELWLTPDDSGIQHSANRLLSIIGWPAETFLSVFPHRTNVWPRPKPLWQCTGRERAARIAAEAAEDGTAGVVILGGHAADAFGLGGEAPFEWLGRFAVVPHPSGRCRYWNFPDSRARARDFFASLLP